MHWGDAEGDEWDVDDDGDGLEGWIGGGGREEKEELKNGTGEVM